MWTHFDQVVMHTTDAYEREILRTFREFIQWLQRQLGIQYWKGKETKDKENFDPCKFSEEKLPLRKTIIWYAGFSAHLNKG